MPEKMRLLTYPNDAEVLRRPVSSVSEEYKNTQEFKENLQVLLKILKESKDPLGMAANQANWPVNLFISTVDNNLEPLSDPRVYVNPSVETESKKMVTADEGCLSFPGLTLSVPRSDAILWNYEDLIGTKFQSFEKYSDSKAGYFIRLVQHESDHLKSVLFIDRVSSTKRLKFEKWLKERK